MRLPYWAALLAAGLCAPVSPAISAGLDDNANMKILGARAKLMRLNHDYFNEQLKQSGAPTNEQEAQGLVGRVGCGSVDIGNQVVSSGIGNEISVIILGDVINVGNRCAR